MKVKRGYSEREGIEEEEIKKPNVKKVLTKQNPEKLPTTDSSRQFFTNILSHFEPKINLSSMTKFSSVFFKDFHIDQNKKDIKHVFMTTYGFDTELLGAVITNSDKLLLVNDSTSGKHKIEENYQGHKHMTLIEPSKHHGGFGYGAFHPKLWLVEFNDGTLRVVVSSGNLCVGDWSVWSNGVWFKDFHLKTKHHSKEKLSDEKAEISEKKKEIDDFGEYLINFVAKMFPKGIENLEKYGGIRLLDYDFKVPVDPILIATMPGRHYVAKPGTPSPNFSSGLERIKQIMKTHAPSKKMNPKNMRIVYQASSVGWLTTGFLTKFIGSFCL